MVRRIAKVTGKVSLALFGILIALAVAELVARQLGPPYPLGNEVFRRHQCDRLVGWRGIPHATTNRDEFGNPHQVTWNSQGMHDTEHALKKDDGIFRILMLGDSFVEAVDVAENQTSHQVLEDVLNSQANGNLKFEVISAGILAWGPPQELAYFREEGKLYEPDLVLALWFPGNDLTDVIPDHPMTLGPQGGVHCFAPYFAICGEQFDPEPWYSAPGIPPAWQDCSNVKRIVAKTLNRIYHNSLLYQRLASIPNVYDKPTFGYQQVAPWVDKNREDEVLNQAYQLTTEIYAQLATEAALITAKTALVIVPFNGALDYEINPTLRAQFVALAPGLEEANPRLPNQVFNELMMAKGLPVFDLHPPFSTHIKSGGQALNWPEDDHWNILGNRLAGEYIAEWLIRQGLVPIKQE